MRFQGRLTGLFALACLIFFQTALTQYIEIRTIPIITANQGDFLPSVARGMGNLTFTFDDPYTASFANPAKGRGARPLTLFLSSTRNSWKNDYGPQVSTSRGSSKYLATTIQSLPLGLLFHAGDFFGGGVAVYQNVDGQRMYQAPSDYWGTASTPHTDKGKNRHISGLLGVQLPALHLSFGTSVSWTQFSALDGVSLLYPGSYDIRQSGWALDYRVGIVGDLSADDRLELVAARGRFSATHEVFYPWYSWIGGPTLPYTREMNEDKTNQWALSAVCKKSIGHGWTLAALAGMNRKEHPKLPDYDLANIPRDPGISSAYNLGLGAIYADDLKTWGYEYIYEPVASDTWAEAGNLWGTRFPPSFRTVENSFRFHNHIARIGHQAHSNLTWLDYRFGAQLHFFDYDLVQKDNVRGTTRSMGLSWMEATLGGGLTGRVGNFQLLYTFQVILGNGTAGIVNSARAPIFLVDDMRGGMAVASDFLVAPSGDVAVNQITLITHQLTLVYTSGL